MNHVENRTTVISDLKYELVGPWEPWNTEGISARPKGTEVDVTKDVMFETVDASYGPWIQAGSRDEILERDRPTKRYGVGVLYPAEVSLEVDPGDLSADDPESPQESAVQGSQDPEAVDGAPELMTGAAEQALEQIARRRRREERESEELDLSTVNARRPSAMALTFQSEISPDSTLSVEFRGGRYRRKTISVQGREWTWWIRSPVRLRAVFESDDLLRGGVRRIEPVAGTRDAESLEDLDLEVSVLTRPRAGNSSLITVSAVNRTAIKKSTYLDEACLFQSRFSAGFSVMEAATQSVMPYPESETRTGSLNQEDESIALLYRDARAFAVGHGCAADWSDPIGGKCSEVYADPMPVAETPNITPQVFTDPAQQIELKVPIAPLAVMVPADDGFAAVREVFDLYEQWIDDQEQTSLPKLEDRFANVATSHISQCRAALRRMRDGFDFVRSDSLAGRAFLLANKAILLQQLRSTGPIRQTFVEGGRYNVPNPLQNLDPSADSERGSWRPFQIAFILSAIESIANGQHPDRETVELIWFPTGGGKTEAYLGLAAFALFYRRLKQPADDGVEVLMRYTLRLLTQQQFQRAASLVCAMESLRREETDLGHSQFSIGMWLGGGTTPNNRADARSVLRQLKQDPRADNQFVLLRCPWCRAEMGPLPRARIRDRRAAFDLRVAGYLLDRNTVVFRCPDSTCEFSGGLPVFVIDEDIYQARPSIVIATVDKFAQLAWRSDCRYLFGIGPDGKRISSPPQTVIQDELHLISGPLGSMVGLFEAVIEDLCTDKRAEVPVRPKIISSTATIRRYEEQIRALYSRQQVALFPPRGIDASDSFFGSYARDAAGRLVPGRVYVGVHAPGLGSLQTAQVRTFSTLLQASEQFSDDEKDPWSTLVIFFNSLRELGTSLSLLQSDIPDYLRTIRNRFGLEWSRIRRIRNPLELTGRLRSDEIPEAIEKLSRIVGNDSVDVCLASNIIEVGIDIDRLSHMVVVGQPKTTAQYIQVTGRVGRRWWERPALVTTIYSPTKPRDRSHFEHFRSYHQTLYASVEPTSVTPFAPPVLDRALHAVMCGYVRQNGRQDLSPRPFPTELVRDAYELLARRVADVDDEELGTLDAVFGQREREWRSWERSRWSSYGRTEEPALLRRAGEYASTSEAKVSWATPISLRNVDAECRAEVSLRYVQEAADV